MTAPCRPRHGSSAIQVYAITALPFAFAIAFHAYILPQTRRSVTVMPHSDAASRVHSLYRLMSRMFTGCRIGVRHDGYRLPDLQQDINGKTFTNHPKGLRMNPIHGILQCKRPCIAVQKAVFRIVKDRLLHCIENQRVTPTAKTCTHLIILYRAKIVSLKFHQSDFNAYICTQIT